MGDPQKMREAILSPRIISRHLSVPEPSPSFRSRVQSCEVVCVHLPAKPSEPMNVLQETNNKPPTAPANSGKNVKPMTAQGRIIGQNRC